MRDDRATHEASGTDREAVPETPDAAETARRAATSSGFRGRVARRLGLGRRRGWAAFGLLFGAKFVVQALVVGVLFVAGCGPVGPFPGGALDGPVGAAVVSDWSFAAEVENAQLETRPDDPHSVNTWFASVDERLYVPTSMILGPKDPTGRSWVAHVAADDRVRIRLGESVFERRAVRVADDSPEYGSAREALEARYDLDPAARDPERIVWIFRLDPR